MSEPMEIPEVWEPGEINTALRKLPAEIARASQMVVNAESDVKQGKHLIAMTEAAVRVEMIDGGKKFMAADIVAITQNRHPEIYSSYLDLEKIFAMKKVRCDYLRDLFDSCRKAANIRIEEARRLEGTLTNRR